ncbi:MliC family protein [Xanthomonas melonis]|uniref:MliC family protein n=1 Tax=Xanthomonas melonis TaxID=56456 RepID=UPI001E5A1938|nr:MliC family protein [Xanthomonas melonis]MCD0246477.1 MliC family protein [Xanthomonas melonis]
MQILSTLISASLLASALAACSAGDRPTTAQPASSPVAGSPAAPAHQPPAGTDASVDGPPPRPGTASAPSDAPSLPADAVAWRCGPRRVTTRFDPASDALRLTLEQRTLTLLGAQAGSGARFADAQGNQFWEHGGEATLSLAGGEAVKCVHEAAATIG